MFLKQIFLSNIKIWNAGENTSSLAVCRGLGMWWENGMTVPQTYLQSQHVTPHSHVQTHTRQKSRGLTRTSTATAAPVTAEPKWTVVHAHIQLSAACPSERKFLPHYTVENWVDHTKSNKHTAERQMPHDSTYTKYLGSVEGKFSSETESRRVVPKVWKQMC